MNSEGDNPGPSSDIFSAGWTPDASIPIRKEVRTKKQMQIFIQCKQLIGRYKF